MAVIDSGSSTAGKANVNSNFELQVALSSDIANAGFAILAAELNDGSVTGTREVLPVSISEEARLAIGVDSIIFNDQFNYTAQNSSNYREPVTTQTVTHTSGYAIVNGSNITTANTNSAIQTYRSFPIYGGFGLEVGMSALHTAAPQANAVTEWGLFTATLPGAAIPTDGVYFRFTSAGTFVCVVNYNGTETISGSLTIPTANVNHAYDILINEEAVIFMVDGVVQYDVDTPAGQGQPFMSPCLPFTMRHYIGATPPSQSMLFKISDLDINLSDMNTAKPWAHAMSTQGMMAYQGQNGGTMGSSALYTNSLAPGAGAAATNTTAALGTGLGGQFSVQPTLAANTDGIMCSFQNPAGTTAISARTLVITGVKIDGIVTTAFTGGPVYYLFSLAYGHTAVSMATAESATAKAPRRIPLGMQTYVVTAGVGVTAPTVSITLQSPISVYAGEFVAVVAKNIGTVTSAGVITLLVSYDAYYE